jgi:hypothetical protein
LDVSTCISKINHDVWKAMASVCLEQLPCWKRLQNTSIPTVLVDSGADGMFMDGIEGNPDNC